MISNSTNKNSYKKDCHLGPKIAIDNKRGLKVYGSSYQEAKHNIEKFDLIISLGKENFDVFSYESSLLRSIDYMKLIKSYKTNRNPEHICLDWPDFSIPSLSKEFYINLSKILVRKGKGRFRREGDYRVLIHCMGGHGRTGTLLSILSYFILDRKEDLIKLIREEYCYKVVESLSQISYIEEITGVKEKIEGSKNSYIGVSYIIGGLDNIKDSSLPIEICRDCRKLYKTVIEAIECKRKHKENINNIENNIEEIIVTNLVGKEIIKEESKLDEYLESRKKWRKEYPL